MPNPFQDATRPLILASASATRLSVLQAAGLEISVRPTNLDEMPIKRAAPDAGTAALRLAEAKAACLDELNPDAFVLGADQILVCDGRSFDKPADLAEAASHLRALRGREHILQTALVCRRDGETIWSHLAQPRLRLRAVSDRFIDRYLMEEGERVLSSVGAYRLEGPGIQLFETVQGEHAAILGLPLLPLLDFLRAQRVLLS
ncbi:Maf family protein [Acetobacteraceae bacterium KSS8]|uniref:Nucleoside triphosphate pyrophosphatase n=1 Tax=Endosaccharibacter trunci TaxID=2812733 RepID=A0ABT1WAZ6_9PROT|nr:Maf family protein [Acetobacteraceae bacterium KSS8]